MHTLIVRNNSSSQAIDTSLLLMSYLNSIGSSAYIVDSKNLGNDLRRQEMRKQLPEHLDLTIVLGGDGTVLHTVHLLEGRNCDILPINFGRLGFLTNSDAKGVIPLTADALAGELAQDKRTLLELDVVCEDEPHTESATEENPDEYGVNTSALHGQRTFQALNEAALTRGAMGRIIELSLSINGVDVFKERGDGIVISTATGSTAYALSSGGPLISPQYSGLLAVPIAPHTLRARAIVTEPNDCLEVSMADTDEFRDATLFIDGELIVFPSPVKRLVCRRSSQSVTLLRPSHNDFYKAVAQNFFS